MKRAQLIAEAVAVLCPECGEAYPNPTDGSEMWTPEDFTKLNKIGRVACVSCEREFVIFSDSKVQFNAKPQTA